MPNIRFRFDPEKLVQALTYLAERGIKDLDKMKAAKLLFYADKYHLLHYGRPVIGDTYVCMEYGPVPSTSLNVMNDVLANDPHFPPLERELFDEYVAVERPALSNYPGFRAKRSADRDVFSESDIEALEHSLINFGDLTAWELSELSHNEPAWMIANQSRPHGSSVTMDYRLFFENEPEYADMLALVEAQQDDRDFADRIAVEVKA